MKVWIVTAAGPKPTEHLKRTIESPVSPEEIFSNLSLSNKENRDLIDTIRTNVGEGPYYLWGAVPGKGNLNNWNNMKPGDICIFYTTGKIFKYWAKIRMKLRDEKLAEFLWDRNDDGKTWELIYFLSKPIRMTLPLKEFNAYHCYKLDFVPQGLAPIKDENVEKVKFLFGSYENFLKRYTLEQEESKFVGFITEVYQNKIQIALNLLKKGNNIIFYGPPGSGKTVLSKILAERYSRNNGGNGYILYTVHSGTDYYDLVARIIPITEDGELIYKKEPRYLLNALLNKKVLILDEINRTQIDTALGFFFTYLEKNHRVQDIEIIKEIIRNEINIAESDENLTNLTEKIEFFRVIGTLNSYDKTFLFKLGDALRRRFTFIEITTDDRVLKKITDDFEEFLRCVGVNNPNKRTTALLELFKEVNKIKELGIGILRDMLLFALQDTFNTDDEAIEEAISTYILPFFENDIHYVSLSRKLDELGYKNAVYKLKRMNYGAEGID